MIDKNEVDAALDEAQMATDDRNDVDIPEAPAVSNVKLWIKGYGVMLTIRGEKMLDIVKKTETLIDLAIDRGWKNVWDKEPQATVGQPTTPQTNVPTCGVHGVPMIWKTGKYKTTTPYHKTGEDFAFWSCGKKNADDSWCNYKVPKK